MPVESAFHRARGGYRPRAVRCAGAGAGACRLHRGALVHPRASLSAIGIALALLVMPEAAGAAASSDESVEPLPSELTEEYPVARSHAERRHHGSFGFDDHPLSVNATFGFGTPVGLAGVVVEYSPLPMLALGLGAGTNIDGLQLAALGRLRPLYWETPERAFAIALTAAVAEGPYSSEDDLAAFTGGLMGLPNTHYAWLDHALWFQPELQFEYETRSHFHLAVTGIGFAFLLNGGAAQCKELPMNPGVTYDETPGCAMNRSIGAFTVELGYSLP